MRRAYDRSDPDIVAADGIDHSPRLVDDLAVIEHANFSEFWHHPPPLGDVHEPVGPGLKLGDDLECVEVIIKPIQNSRGISFRFWRPADAIAGSHGSGMGLNTGAESIQHVLRG